MTKWIIVHGIAGDPIRVQVRNIISYRKGQTEKLLSDLSVKGMTSWLERHRKKLIC